MAKNDILRERINSALKSVISAVGDAYDVVRILGLPTFSEFEKAIAPLLRRVPPHKRGMLLEGLYVVTAQQLLNRGGRRNREDEVADFRKRRILLGRTRAHIIKARKSVSVAEAIFPRFLPTSFDFKEIIKRLSEFETDLAKREQWLAAYVHPRFKNKTEKRIPPPEHPVRPFPWTSDNLIRQSFIQALDECLPVTRKGTRSPFPRNEVMQKVLKAVGTTVGIRSIIRARKLRNATPKGAKKK
jgi:hypothetical protein